LQTLNCEFQISQQTLNHQVSKKLKIRKKNKENITKNHKNIPEFQRFMCSKTAADSIDFLTPCGYPENKINQKKKRSKNYHLATSNMLFT
jgi:hypothetical protein